MLSRREQENQLKNLHTVRLLLQENELYLHRMLQSGIMQMVAICLVKEATSLLMFLIISNMEVISQMD